MNLDPIKDYIPEKMKVYWLLFKIAIISYVAIFILTSLVLPLFNVSQEINSKHLEGQSAIYFTICFFIFSTPIIYFGNSLFKGKYIKLSWQSLILYVGLAMFFGTSLEIIVNSLFVFMIERPSWIYHIWPKYGGYTSGVTCIMWPLYGFHLYCFHQAMSYRNSILIKNTMTKSIMMAIDAIIMETIANLFALLTFQSYYFFYLKNDLNHFTTIEIFVPYILVGLFIMNLFRVLDKPTMPRALIGIVSLLIGWFVLFSGIAN